MINSVTDNPFNIEAARSNMITQQARACDVFDQRILETLDTVPRENFVPAKYRKLAFMDEWIPLEHEQVMLRPFEEGKILQAAQIQPGDRILEIGTGTGYMTALLAKLGKTVDTVDIFPKFVNQARTRLTELGVTNIQASTADASHGWPGDGPYDVIILTSACEQLAKSFAENLTIGGRLFAFIGKSPTILATLFTRTSETQWHEAKQFETDLPKLINADTAAGFVF